jgi:hypothetical protein
VYSQVIHLLPHPIPLNLRRISIHSIAQVAVNFIEWQQKGEDYETSESAPGALLFDHPTSLCEK